MQAEPNSRVWWVWRASEGSGETVRRRWVLLVGLNELVRRIVNFESL